MEVFFHKNDKSDASLAELISAACEGLIYISETDAPVTLFQGSRVENVAREIILQQSGLDQAAIIEEITFDQFFERLTVVKDWYGEAEKERAKKFAGLQKLLGENLRDRKVFRIGEIRLDIFAVGIDKDGFLTGITTKAVET
ncbi:MAG: nuclease A inhibitor family protein [Pyrinomonadaceae bacterium]